LITPKEVGIDYNLAAKSKAAGGIREQEFEAPLVQMRKRIASGEGVTIDAVASSQLGGQVLVIVYWRPPFRSARSPGSRAMDRCKCRLTRNTDRLSACFRDVAISASTVLPSAA
jgi:hypothetical protein